MTKSICPNDFLFFLGLDQRLGHLYFDSAAVFLLVQLSPSSDMLHIRNAFGKGGAVQMTNARYAEGSFFEAFVTTTTGVATGGRIADLERFVVVAKNEMASSALSSAPLVAAFIIFVVFFSDVLFFLEVLLLRGATSS